MSAVLGTFGLLLTVSRSPCAAVNALKLFFDSSQKGANCFVSPTALTRAFGMRDSVVTSTGFGIVEASSTITTMLGLSAEKCPECSFVVDAVEER